MNNRTNRNDDSEALESIEMDCAAAVLGDPANIESALAEIGAFTGKNARGGIGQPRTWDAFSLADVRDADGEFNPLAPAGALLYGLLFGDDKTSGRCRYALAERVEKQLAPEISAAVSAKLDMLVGAE